MITRLYLDLGNSRLKWGLRQNRRWLDHGALNPAEFKNLTALLTPLPRYQSCTGVCVATPERQRDLVTLLPTHPIRWLHSAASECGVVNGYDDGSQLGADRWMALIAARARSPGPTVVVMAGTATTIDALDGSGLFLGGLILPGLAHFWSGLCQVTSLEPVSPTHPPVIEGFPRSTASGLVSGAREATLGAIERIRSRLGKQSTVVLGGGNAQRLAPALSPPVIDAPLLVLEGLARRDEA